MILLFFFFNDTATTEIYTLSLHDALPILGQMRGLGAFSHHDLLGLDEVADLDLVAEGCAGTEVRHRPEDRKSTRLNSSHVEISYAVFCLKKKKKKTNQTNLKQPPT